MKGSKMSTLSFLVSPSLKKESRKIFENLRINMTDAMRMFLVQVVKRQAILFEIRMYNRDTIEAIEEVKNNLSSLKRYASSEEMFKDLAKDDTE